MHNTPKWSETLESVPHHFGTLCIKRLIYIKNKHLKSNNSDVLVFFKHSDVAATFYFYFIFFMLQVHFLDILNYYS